jgi:hypothetical protein
MAARCSTRQILVGVGAQKNQGRIFNNEFCNGQLLHPKHRRACLNTATFATPNRIPIRPLKSIFHNHFATSVRPDEYEII